MMNIKLIDRDTDISRLKIRQMGWDTVINGKPYFVVQIAGYVHTIGGKYSNNDLWAYPRACLKKAFCKMCVTICGIFCPNEGAVAGYGN